MLKMFEINESKPLYKYQKSFSYESIKDVHWMELCAKLNEIQRKHGLHEAQFTQNKFYSI